MTDKVPTRFLDPWAEAAEAAEQVVAEGDGERVVEYEVPAYREEDADNLIAKLNRRLETAGSDARLTFDKEHFERTETVGATELIDPLSGAVVERWGGTEVKVPWVRYTLTSPLRLTIGDYTFVASLIPEEAGIVVHTAPGQDLHGWRPAEFNKCDHCGLQRDRTRVYIVRNDKTGELVQLGHNCIELYTGLAPKGLFALTYEQELRGFADEDRGGGYSQRDYAIGIDLVLATAFAYADQGRAYQSAKGREWGYTPTVDKVRTHIFVGPPNPANYPNRRDQYEKDLAEYRAKCAEIDGYLADEQLLADIKASVEAVKAGTDYGDNLRIILASESGSVRDRNVGILASLVAVYAREKELAVKREREAKAPKVKGFLGKEKERLRNLEITLVRVRVFPDGEFGPRTLLVGDAASGHRVEWWASGHFDYEAGDVLKLEAATVKLQKPEGYDQYTKVDTTVLTRGVIDTFEERAEQCRDEIARNGEAYEVLDTEKVIDPATGRETYKYVEVTREDGVTYRKQATKQVPVTERWFTKKEAKRFAEWLKDHPKGEES